MENILTTAPTSNGIDPTDYDGFYIGAIICFVAGGILLVAAIVRLIVWVVEIKKDRSLSKKTQRHLQHMRHLEEYSIKAGDSPNDVIVQNNNTPAADNDSVFKWDEGLVNAGYISEDTLKRHSPKEPKLRAHATGSTSSYSQQMARLSTGSQPTNRPPSIMINGSQPQVSMAPSAPEGGTLGRKRISTIDVPAENRSTSNKDRLADEPV